MIKLLQLLQDTNPDDLDNGVTIILFDTPPPTHQTKVTISTGYYKDYSTAGSVLFCLLELISADVIISKLETYKCKDGFNLVVDTHLQVKEEDFL